MVNYCHRDHHGEIKDSGNPQERVDSDVVKVLSKKHGAEND
jgi:hypothetical protein